MLLNGIKTDFSRYPGKQNTEHLLIFLCGTSQNRTCELLPDPDVTTA